MRFAKYAAFALITVAAAAFLFGAKGDVDARRASADLAERIRRIKRLIARQCQPLDHGDTMLAGCAQGQDPRQ